MVDHQWAICYTIVLVVLLIDNLGSNYASILLGEDTAFQAVGAGSNPTTRSNRGMV